MDVLDKFFIKYSYKFPKGYPDLKDKQDILLMESILEGLDVKINLREIETLEEVDFLNDMDNPPIFAKNIKSDLNKYIDEIGHEMTSIQRKGEDSDHPVEGIYYLYFKGIPQKGPKRLELLKTIFEKVEFTDTFKVGTSTDKPYFTGEFEIPYRKGTSKKPIKFFIKGSGKEFATDTDEKEGLVVAFYNAGKAFDKKPFTEENYQKNIKSFFETDNWGQGLDDNTKNKIKNFLLRVGKSTEPKSVKEAIKTLNDPLSIAKMINGTYSGHSIIRDDEFKDIKNNAVEILSKTFPTHGIKDPDKWNPGDIFIKLKKAEITSPEKAEDESEKEVILDPITKINQQFVDKWGETGNKDYVSISLKGGAAQLGRAKSYINRLVTDPDGLKMDATEEEKIYLWSSMDQKDKDEVADYYKGNYDVDVSELENINEKLKTEIKAYRYKISKLPNIEHNIQRTGMAQTDPFPSTNKKLYYKFMAYKLLYYFLKQSQDKRQIEPALALAGIAGFSHTVTKYNPTFFKITGNEKGEADRFRIQAGTTTGLEDGKKIEIVDSEGSADLSIKVPLQFKKGDENLKVKNTTVTFRTSGGNVGVQAVAK